MRKGREAVVRFTNSGPTNISVHVHGQYNRAPFDGRAADYTHPGQYKDYHYPNAQNARTIWYHDHTEFVTGENVYRGQAGFYLLKDEEEDADSALIYDTNGNNNVFGDIIQVNGQPWSYMQVEPRKYRFRLLNSVVSRIFNISLHEGLDGDAIRFDMIASDSGLFNHSIPTTSFAFSMGERYELIIDFSPNKGRSLTLCNERGAPGIADYAATDLVMRFQVTDATSSDTNNGPISPTLRQIPPPPQTNTTTKTFAFERVDDVWAINGVGWADIENRILTRPALGTDEIWELQDGDAGGVHPVHIHLVDFQVLSRTRGRGGVQGMFHCHNMVHEDHNMLVAFNVTNLEKWGYNESTVFIDPMEAVFRLRDIRPEEHTLDAIWEKLEWFWGLNAYNRTVVG
ncbi:hypothetical protein GQ44DRAFT_828866 [Phaeosphaeriaceae sp. PMI808]|nr:hypothetical protein GQ44DRAFT_828866 [Phaeosphaeriaceae sp. PMI808]